MDSESLDQAVQDLSNTISPQIDCTQCGNCCKSLMVNINEQEADHLAQHLGQKNGFKCHSLSFFSGK
jgi:Fe-S-cluster containining protein